MCKCRFIILFLFTLVSVLKVEAQESMHFFFPHITESDGLLQNEVASIAQDGKGFIWGASSNELHCYDGELDSVGATTDRNRSGNLECPRLRKQVNIYLLCMISGQKKFDK